MMEVRKDGRKDMDGRRTENRRDGKAEKTDEGMTSVPQRIITSGCEWL